MFFETNTCTTNDYYAFGGLIPGRHAQTSAYRLGFNGKENDNELLGEGHLQDYGFWPYLPALGRFFSVDPLTQKYPELTPYQFASNTPIQAVDLDGLESYRLDFQDVNDKKAAEKLFPNDPQAQQAWIRKQQVARGHGALVGAGIVLGVYTAPAVATAALPHAYRFGFWAYRNQNLIAAGGMTAAGALDPNPAVDYPGGFDNLGRSFRALLNNSSTPKLLLGKADVLGNYVKDAANAFHMFKDGFGFGWPSVLSPENIVLKSMYQIIEDGGLIVLDLTNVSISAAKKGFTSLSKATEDKMFTEWELSKIMRDKDLLNNTLFREAGTDQLKTAEELGIKYIDE